MDHWLERQLISMVLTDLKEFIPVNYFSNTKSSRPNLENSSEISDDLNWGELAATLGKELNFNKKILLTPRQVSASELLMFIGFLVCARAIKDETDKLILLSNENKIESLSLKRVNSQIKKNHIKSFERDLLESAEQYFKYLSPQEAKPFNSLIKTPKTQAIKQVFKWCLDNVFGVVISGVILVIIITNFNL